MSTDYPDLKLYGKVVSHGLVDLSAISTTQDIDNILSNAASLKYGSPSVPYDPSTTQKHIFYEGPIYIEELEADRIGDYSHYKEYCIGLKEFCNLAERCPQTKYILTNYKRSSRADYYSVYRKLRNNYTGSYFESKKGYEAYKNTETKVKITMKKHPQAGHFYPDAVFLIDSNTGAEIAVEGSWRTVATTQSSSPTGNNTHDYMYITVLNEDENNNLMFFQLQNIDDYTSKIITQKYAQDAYDTKVYNAFPIVISAKIGNTMNNYKLTIDFAFYADGSDQLNYTDEGVVHTTIDSSNSRVYGYVPLVGTAQGDFIIYTVKSNNKLDFTSSNVISLI